MPLPGGEPLHVAAAEARGRAERVGVVDEALAHEGDGLEAAMRVLREAGHGAAVVHPPAVGAREVHADVARRERRRRAHVLVGLGVQVEVVDAEQERIDGGPLEAERDGLNASAGADRAATARGVI